MLELVECYWRLHDDRLSRSDTVHECDIQTDRQTDGQPCDSKGPGCIASHGKNYHYSD